MTTIEDVAKSFEGIAERIEKTWLPHIPLETTLRQKTWHEPALAPENAIWLAYEIAERLRATVKDDGKPETVEADEFWAGMSRQAEQMDFQSFASDIFTVAKSTFDFLIYCTVHLPTRPADVNWDEVKTKGYIPRDLARKIGSIEKRLAGLSPRTDSLESKIDAIEAAHDAAEQLPTDMEELRRNNEELRKLLSEAQKTAAVIENNREMTKDVRAEVEDLRTRAAEMANQSQHLVEKCEENYRITTSAGLAGAFETRSRSLTKTGWVWVTLLATSLGCAVGIGYSRLEAYEELLRSSASTSVILLNLLVTVLGVGGPIWLAWLSTKNIGQSFKLAEDYAFKASISKAYEGYRKEAVNLDQEFAKQLFGSALTRLDELPSRFMSSADHNTPLQEMLDNPTIKELLSKFPELKEAVVRFLVDQKSAAAATAGAVVAATAVKARPNGKALSDDDAESEPKDSEAER